MPDYIDVPIDTDPQDVLNDFVSYMQTVIPGWQPSPGQLDFWLAQAVAAAAAESRDVASAVPKSIFRWFGASLINFPPIDATPASVNSTWTMKDTAGYTIPAGTQVTIAKSGDEVFSFETQVNTIVAPGSTVATNVLLIATDAGLDSSNLGVAGAAISLIDPLSFVSSVTQAAATSGGTDAEDDDAYLTRLAGQLQLLAPRPILPADFAQFAKQIAGVSRATAINGYNPNTGSTTDARTIAVAAVDANGNPVSTAVKAAIQADLVARREVNFVVNVIDPTINLVNVTYNVKALVGYDLTALVAAINLALNTYLSPATWGSSDGTGTDWNLVTTVRYLEVAAVINAVAGVDYITTTAGNYDLTIAIQGNALARADLTLTGVAPLPDANTLTGTAS